MKIAIMQPYFFPYIGYFQLINIVDQFVIYDNIQFTKKGWIKRNRIINNARPCMISVATKPASSNSMIRDIEISESYDYHKLLRRIYNAYQAAPYFEETYSFLGKTFPPRSKSLFDYLNTTLQEICKYLGIRTPFVTSSTILIDHTLKSQNKVIALCKALNVDEYINPIGGEGLYRSDDFRQQGINLGFIGPLSVVYKQFSDEFIPDLSIIDVMMFNSRAKIKHMLHDAKVKSNDMYVSPGGALL